jgi:phenylalanyl-tRNA synthetase beta chain
VIDSLRLPEGDPRRELVAVSNPLSAELSALRPLLLASLLDAAALNLARGAERVTLFESGHVYLREAPGELPGAAGPLAGRFPGHHPAPVHEPHRLGYMVSGPAATIWRGEPAPPDFFAVKGVLESLCGQLGVDLDVAGAEQPFLHPGRSAAIRIGAVDAGWIGELHPLVARAWDLEGGTAFELELGALVAASALGRERYEDVITYPAVHQDIAVVVPESVPAAEVRGTVVAAGGELLRSAALFDLYRGEQVGEGRKSLALRLSFQAPDRTLTEDEVSAERARIQAALEQIGGSLRE